MKPAKRPSLCRLQSIRYVVYRLVVEERTSISKWFYVQFTVVGVRQMNVKRTDKVCTLMSLLEIKPASWGHKIRQSKINSRSVAGPMGQMNRQPSV